MAKRRTKAQIAADKASVEQAPQEPEREGPAAKPTDLPDVPSTTQEHKTLSLALLAAQRSVVAIERDANHESFGKYTSSENMVRFCRQVMHVQGLTARGASREVLAPKHEGGQNILRSTFEVAHAASDTSFREVFDLPIQTTGMKGTVMATASDATLKANTISLSYFLRDLLALPRYEDTGEEAKGIVSENFQTPQPTDAPPIVGSPAPQVISAGKELYMTDMRVDALKKLMAAASANEAKTLASYDVKSLALLNQSQHEHLVGLLTDRLEVDEAARATGGAVVSFEAKTPPPQPKDDSLPAPITPAQVNLVQKTLAAQGKEEVDLLAHFAQASVANIPAAHLNAVMAWMTT